MRWRIDSNSELSVCYKIPNLIKPVLSLAESVKNSVDGMGAIAGIWYDIVQNLYANDIDAWSLMLAQHLAVMRPALIESWKRVKDAVQRYMDNITSN